MEESELSAPARCVRRNDNVSLLFLFGKKFDAEGRLSLKWLVGGGVHKFRE